MKKTEVLITRAGKPTGPEERLRVTRGGFVEAMGMMMLRWSEEQVGLVVGHFASRAKEIQRDYQTAAQREGGEPADEAASAGDGHAFLRVRRLEKQHT